MTTEHEAQRGMRLWLLERRKGLGDDDPWDATWDMAYGYVVRALSAEDARKLVTNSGETGDEVRQNPDAWLSERYSTCVELTADGESRVVLCDFCRG